MTIFDPAQATVGCNPEGTVRIGFEGIDAARAKPVFGRIRCADSSVSEIRHSTIPGAQPKTPMRIRDNGVGDRSTKCQGGPGKLLDHLSVSQTNEAFVTVCDPEVSGTVSGDWAQGFEVGIAQAGDPAVFEVSQALERGDPDSSLTVLEKRGHEIVRQSVCSYFADLCARFVRQSVSGKDCASLHGWVVIDGDLPVLPSV